jgi:hypothetical protein
MMTYVPAFAKTGINEIRNAIYQRMADITRVTTSKTYNQAVSGIDGGVDRKGSTMDYFLGTEALTELMVLGKVGIYVDYPSQQPANYAEALKMKPYIYIYKAEQIRSWAEDEHGRLLSVLLEDVYYDADKDYQLPLTTTTRYRFYWFGSDGYVRCQFYDRNGDQEGPEMRLGIKIIPLHILKLSSSLMTDICDYQIALLNMASSDVQFSRWANYPLYMEQYDPFSETVLGAKQGSTIYNNVPGGFGTVDNFQPGPNGVVVGSGDQLRVGGNLTGRRFPKGVEYPQWLAPDTTSLTQSMAKQEQMKAEIRSLLYLTLGNLAPSRQSADSKAADVSQEENGLSYIGFELMKAENRICEFWHAYEGNTNPFTIKYPQTYNIKTTSERIDEASGYIPLIKLIPSTTYKKEVSKIIVQSLLGGRSTFETLEKINSEIDANKLIIDPEQILNDVESKLVSHELASRLRGYPNGEYEKAAEEAVAQAEEIMKAQTAPESNDANGIIENPAARGVRELSADPKADIQRDRNKRKPYKARGQGKKPSKEDQKAVEAEVRQDE